ncbi:MAG: helix-hairpin-helix domain-containing protein, partial [Bacteroidota bacterium]
MKCLISFFLLCLLFANSFAQNKQISSRNTVVQELLERWIENNESTIDYTDLQEQLEYYYNNKLDLNKCSQKDLMSLVFLSPRQADAIIKHRLELGNFMSVFELQVIPEIDEQTIYYLKYFVAVNVDWMQDQTPFWQMIRKGKNELILLHENDFQKKEGYN